MANGFTTGGGANDIPYKVDEDTGAITIMSKMGAPVRLTDATSEGHKQSVGFDFLEKYGYGKGQEAINKVFASMAPKYQNYDPNDYGTINFEVGEDTSEPAKPAGGGTQSSIPLPSPDKDLQEISQIHLPMISEGSSIGEGSPASPTSQPINPDQGLGELVRYKYDFGTQQPYAVPINGSPSSQPGQANQQSSQYGQSMINALRQPTSSGYDFSDATRPNYSAVMNDLINNKDYDYLSRNPTAAKGLALMLSQYGYNDAGDAVYKGNYQSIASDPTIKTLLQSIKQSQPSANTSNSASVPQAPSQQLGSLNGGNMPKVYFNDSYNEKLNALNAPLVWEINTREGVTQSDWLPQGNKQRTVLYNPFTNEYEGTPFAQWLANKQKAM